jgi:hypothetical protein
MRRVSRPTEKPAVRPRRMAKESWGLGVSVGLLVEGKGIVGGRMVVVGVGETYIDHDGLDSHTHTHTHTHKLATNAMGEIEMWKCRTCL